MFRGSSIYLKSSRCACVSSAGEQWVTSTACCWGNTIRNGPTQATPFVVVKVDIFHTYINISTTYFFCNCSTQVSTLILPLLLPPFEHRQHRRQNQHSGGISGGSSSDSCSSSCISSWCYCFLLQLLTDPLHVAMPVLLLPLPLLQQTPSRHGTSVYRRRQQKPQQQWQRSGIDSRALPLLMLLLPLLLPLHHRLLHYTPQCHGWYYCFSRGGQQQRLWAPRLKYYP